MAIIELIMDFTGETDVNPRLGRMVSTDNLQTILAPGYLNAATTFIGAPFRETDFLMTSYNANTMPAQITLGVSISSDGTISLSEPNGTGDVIGPSGATDNGLVLFNGTSGTVIKEASGTGTVQITSGSVSTYPTTPTGQEFINLSDVLAMQAFLELAGSDDSLAGYGPTGELANIGLGTGFSIDGSGDLQFNGSFQNPMTNLGDIIVAGAAGAANRLGVGANTLVLTANSSAPLGVEWAESSSGFANPMTTEGDLIVGGTSGVASRLGIGTDGQALQASSIAADGVTWGAINLASSTSVTGNLPVTHLNSGTNAGSLTFWSGDSTWKTAVTSVGASTSSTGLSITGSPVTTSGSLTFSLSSGLQALSALSAASGIGLVTQTGVNTFLDRTIAGTANQITVTNGNGVSGNPTISLPISVSLGVPFSSSGQLILNNTTGGSTGIISSADGADSYNFNLPPTGGVANQIMLATGGGATNWANFNPFQSYPYWQTYTPTGTNSVVITFPTGPFAYDVIFKNIFTSGDDQMLVAFSNDGGNTFPGGTIQGANFGYWNGTVPSTSGATNGNSVIICGYTAFFSVNFGFSGKMTIWPGNSTSDFNTDTNFVTNAPIGLAAKNVTNGSVGLGSVNAVRFTTSHNITSGDFVVFLYNQQ